jgi:RNA polymerase sigma-70 factor (ECF subfamily)
VDPADFKRFYEQSAPALRAYLRFSCRDWALADDLLQESYLRLLRFAPPALDEAKLKGYLYKTAHSVLIDHVRRAERDRRFAREAAIGDAAAAATAADGIDACESELPRYLRLAFAALAPRERRLLWLAYVEGFSHREIAELVGVGENSVKVLLLRARVRMGRVLADRGIGPEEA